jgi:hypothetical protein
MSLFSGAWNISLFLSGIPVQSARNAFDPIMVSLAGHHGPERES